MGNILVNEIPKAEAIEEDRVERLPSKYAIFRDSLRKMAHNDWLRSNNQFNKRLPGPAGTDVSVEVNGKPMQIHRWTMLYKDLNLISNEFARLIGQFKELNPANLPEEKQNEVPKLTGEQKAELYNFKDKLKKRFKSTKTYGKFIPEGIDFDYLDQFTAEQLYQWYKDVNRIGMTNNDNWVDNAKNIIDQLGIKFEELGNLNYKQIETLEETQKAFLEMQSRLRYSKENTYYEELIKQKANSQLVINSMIFAHNNWRITQTMYPPKGNEVVLQQNLEEFIYESEEIELLIGFFEKGVEEFLKENPDNTNLEISLPSTQQTFLKKILGKVNLEEQLTIEDISQLEIFEVLKLGINQNIDEVLLQQKVETFKKKFIDTNPHISSIQSFGLMVAMMHSLEIQMKKQATDEDKSKYLKALNYIKDQVALDCNPKIVQGIIEANTTLAKKFESPREL